MSSCTGRGECFEQTDIERYSRHACKYNCGLVECHNFKLCGKKRPQRILDCHMGMCMDCAVHIGKIQFLGEKDDCPICMEHKEVVKICCGKHSVCVTCWKEWSDANTDPPLSCPLCRETIWK